MMKQVVFLVCALWMTLAVAHGEQLTHYNVPLSVLEDASGALTIDEVVSLDQQNAFTRVNRVAYADGYTRHVHWFKLQLMPMADVSELLLEIQPSFLDDVQVFIPNNTGKSFQQWQFGDRQPFSTRPIAYRSFVLPLTLSHTPTTVYVRMRTESTTLFMAKAWQPAAFYQATQTEYALLAFFIGVMLTLIILNVWQGIWRLGRLFIYYLCYLVLSFDMLWIDTGLLNQFITPYWPLVGDMMLPLHVLFIIITLSLLYKKLFALQWQTHALLISLNWGMVALAGMAIFAWLAGYYIEVMPWVLGYGAVLSFIWLVKSVYALRRASQDAWWILLFSVFGIVSLLTTIFMLLGWISSENILIYSYQFSLLGSVLTLQPLIAHRVKQLIATREAALCERDVAWKEMQSEKEMRHIQSGFMAMLTHELKAPLSIIRMVLGLKDVDSKLQQNAAQAVQDINRVIECCACAEKLDSGKFLLAPHWFDIRALIDSVLEETGATILLPSLTHARAYSDDYLLRVILFNLVENALKYRLAGSQVSVQLLEEYRANQGGYVIHINNRIDRRYAPNPDKVFDKYYRGASAHGVTGSGLGLYIVKGLVSLMQGEIAFTLQDDAVCLTLWLPKEYQ